jgi:hypothetical protein|tara:strand:+ start:14592 stop:14906 length:315 start_codon:yes stop_codon:yes gene_type:complete
MNHYDNITTVVVTMIAVLFSAGAWRFYERKIKLKTKLETLDRTDQNMYRDDLRERVKRLEKLLLSSSEEKDIMRDQILSLTKEVSALHVKVDFLEKENQRLKSK